MISLRRATLLSLAGLLTVVGLVGAVGAYIAARIEASEFLDLQQQQIARYVGDLSFVAPQSAALPPHDSEDDYVVEVSHHDGRPMRSSNPRVRIPDSPTTGFTEFTDGGTGWRVFSLVTEERTVRIAQQLAVRRELATEASIRAAAPLIVAIPLTWLLLELIVGRIFAPLARTADEIAGRDAADTTPIPTARVPTEVLPLVKAMNDLLTRLRAELARQRAFLSDAAHELRTPLTAVTLQIGNLRRVTVDPAVVERLEDLEAGAHRAAALTSQLLRLARYDSPAGPPPRDAVDLDAIAAEVVGGLLPLAESRGVDLGLLGRHPAPAIGSAADVRIMIEVLVDNAVRYTPEGGTVDVSLEAAAAGVSVVVRDSGPGVPPDLLPRLQERFFRGPDAEGEGSGLGLAIATTIANRNGVGLALANRHDAPGFVARLTFPVRSESPAGRISPSRA